jgi:hypothetical protein
MYREVAQWRHVRRSILEKGTPKRQVARDTGISRRTINKMLMHENPPRYGPRPPLYPKLGPYISAIDELISSNPAADLTIGTSLSVCAVSMVLPAAMIRCGTTFGIGYATTIRCGRELTS